MKYSLQLIATIVMLFSNYSSSAQDIINEKFFYKAYTSVLTNSLDPILNDKTFNGNSKDTILNFKEGFTNIDSSTITMKDGKVIVSGFITDDKNTVGEFMNDIHLQVVEMVYKIGSEDVDFHDYTNGYLYLETKSVRIVSLPDANGFTFEISPIPIKPEGYNLPQPDVDALVKGIRSFSDSSVIKQKGFSVENVPLQSVYETTSSEWFGFSDNEVNNSVFPDFNGMIIDTKYDQVNSLIYIAQLPDYYSSVGSEDLIDMVIEISNQLESAGIEVVERSFDHFRPVIFTKNAQINFFYENDVYDPYRANLIIEITR